MKVRKQFKRVRKVKKKKKSKKQLAALHKRKDSLSRRKLKNWSLAIRRRDKFTCTSCGARKKLHAHHTISKFYHPEIAYELSNGITLCRTCHVGDGGVHDYKVKPKNKVIARLRRKFKANR